MMVLTKASRLLKQLLLILPNGNQYHSFFTDIYRLLRHILGVVQRDFCDARGKLLLSVDLTNDEKRLLDKVSIKIHPADTMYASNALHYLSVGISAVRCIKEAISSNFKDNMIESVLDFPCGHGRVLRFLQVMFPYSEITAAEIDGTALDFCGRTFNVNTVLSKKRISEVYSDKKYDFIWCGSLFTNIDERSALELLRFFCEHLSDKGLCVFTTHGRRSIEMLRSKKSSYGLTEDDQQKVIWGFNSSGYGYADFFGQSGYGISSVSRFRVLEMAKSVGIWKETLFIENGWDDQQDVYAFSKRLVDEDESAICQ